MLKTKENYRRVPFSLIYIYSHYMIIQLWVVPKGTVIIDNGLSFESLSRSYHQSWGWVIFQISWVRFVITNEQSINGQTPHLTLLMTSALFSEVSVTVSDNSWLQNCPTLCDQSAKQNVLQVTLRWFTVKLFYSIITTALSWAELSKISAKNFYLHSKQFFCFWKLIDCHSIDNRLTSLDG